MRGQNLERFIPYDLRATMHDLPRIMDWCAGRLHLRFLTRELNHRSLEHVRNLLAIMEMAWNGRAGLNLDDPHDDFHVRAGQIDPLQDRVMHSRRMLDLLGSTVPRTSKLNHCNGRTGLVRVRMVMIFRGP